MHSCSQQAASSTTGTVHCRGSLIAVASVTTAPSLHHSQHTLATRLPRSPPTSPRQLIDPADPDLVKQLRVFLFKAAHRPAGVTDELEQLLQSKLNLSQQDIDNLLAGDKLEASLSRSNGTLPCQQLQELESGLDQMLQLFSRAEVVHLLQQQPALLFTPMASWCEFFIAYGFSSSQIKNLISQTHGEVLTKGTLVTAGAAILHLKALGFDNEEIRHRVVAYCPQVLAMSTHDIDVLIRLWDKFKVGVDERSGM